MIQFVLIEQVISLQAHRKGTLYKIDISLSIIIHTQSIAVELSNNVLLDPLEGAIGLLLDQDRQFLLSLQYFLVLIYVLFVIVGLNAVELRMEHALLFLMPPSIILSLLVFFSVFHSYSREILD